MNLKDLKKMKISELIQVAKNLGIDNETSLKKQDLIFSILNEYTKKQEPIFAEGVLECLSDGFGFLRSQDYNYLPSPDDVYVSPSQIRKFSLRTGDTVAGQIRSPKDNERYFALLKVEEVNFESADHPKSKGFFDNMVAVYPNQRFDLSLDLSSKEGRLIDLIAPIAKGQRSLLVGAPRSGKTTLLKKLASNLHQAYPNAHVMALLINDRPEEIHAFETEVPCEVISSTFDENSSRHVQIAEMVLEKAKRLVECQKDVILLVDSINRLNQAYQDLMRGNQLSLGLDSLPLQKVKKFLSTARNVDEGGSLTIIATANAGNERTLDQMLYDELREGLTHELHLSGFLAQQGIFPNLDVQHSFSRREDLFYRHDQLDVLRHFRLALQGMKSAESLELLTDLLQTQENTDKIIEKIKQLGK